MFERVYAMLVKEFLELKRDRWALFRLVVPLVLQVFIYGYAATFTVSHVSTAVLDLDGSQASRDLIARFTANGRFEIVDFPRSQKDIAHELDAGRAQVAVVIQAGFARALGQGRGAPLQVLVDGTNSNTALIALGYVSKIVAQYQGDWLATGWHPRAGAAPPAITVALQERPWFNEGLDDRWFFIPGVIGTLTLLQVVSLTAFAVVREREVGTLEQIMVSPIRPVEFILGKTAPSFLIGLGDVAIVATLGVAWFDVPFVGSIFVMLVGVVLFLLAVIGLGLLLSTFSRTQQQAFALN
ncbi:MAG: ABC transporter permease, partial [Burkholderiales bacterium]|nr:ABC transporter permease [Burkholderiales bacterium]